MKLGLDLHGVLDTNPEFVEIAKQVKEEGGEVHIITGSSLTDEVLTIVKNSGIDYDYIVSIQDELIKLYLPNCYNEYNRPIFPDILWDSFKGRYCKDNNIDLHYDDTEEYIDYFSTPVILYKSTKLGKK